MLKDLSSRNDPLPTIQKLIKECYVDAKAVFWAGSVSVNQGTSASDLDLVIVYERVPNAYREAFTYDGREVTNPSAFSKNVKIFAQKVLNTGPAIWDQEQINKERFLITDVLDDIKSPKNKEEQIISAVHLLEPLLQFYFRAQKKWTASGKFLIRLFKQENPELAEEWTTAFEILIQTGDASSIENAVIKDIGTACGMALGLDAPPEWRLSIEDNRHANVKSDELEKIHALEIALLEPQVRKDIKKLDRLIADNFYEIGASGKVYDKNNILARLPLEQNYEIYGKVINFEIARISENLIRANYTLEEKTKRMRRTSIWQRHHNNYQIIFHQGTVIDEGSI